MSKEKQTASEVFGETLLWFAGVFIIATLKGTVLWLTFPYIHKLFPSALQNGILPAELEWWSAICITYIFASIFPAKSKSKISKES